MASRPQQIVLILGGDGKGADFAPLLQACISSPQTGPSAVKAVVTLGRDGPTLAALCALIYLLKKRATCLRWYKKAAALAQPGIWYSYRPPVQAWICLRIYEARGALFAQWVEQL